MAAQSKTTAVHFSLIFFVMLSVILGVVAYLFYADFREQTAQLDAAKKDSTGNKTAYDRAQSEVDELKKLVGVPAEEVGVAVPGNDTVLTQARQAIQTLGSNPSAPSFAAAMRDLRTELDNKNIEIAERQATIADLQAQLEALNVSYQTTSAEHDKRAQSTEADLAGQQQEKEESLGVKDQEIAALRQQNGNLLTEIEQTKQQLGAEIAKLREENQQVFALNERHRKELENIRGESFEVADGKIVRVDQVGRTVWIDLGKSQNLRPRTTFSVYAQNNAGIGRQGRPKEGDGRPEDIKGSIEVTRVDDNNMAEARILYDDPSRPISPGDPIYTPLWSAGRTEKFAFVGLIDIDNDGSYVGDRERLHEVVEANGAQIISEVNEVGERLGGRINEQTRFLVIGTIPDPLDEADAARRDQLKQIGQHRSEMIKEADVNGVRKINLNTFLDYIGYVPQQRRWVPGENPSWTLEAGSRPAAQRSSTGNTSGLFDTSRRRPNPSGTTSQTFGDK
ncbi:MAG: hypothetical protein H0T47_23130 [Planctomycetaceae bacterium]|nr:hypothetical protein [Planctomycetaceae bacterium]